MDLRASYKLLDAAKEAYKYDWTKPIQKMLVSFFWASRCTNILGKPEALDLINTTPEFSKDLLKLFILPEISSVSPWILL